MASELADVVVERPKGLSEALDLRSAGAEPYCGGTELVAAMRLGLLRPRTIMSLRRVPELSQVSEHEGLLRVGGAVTHHTLERDPTVGRLAPLLSDVARRVGNVRVRSVGTVGGNLCFAEPRSDLGVLLTALGATVTLQSPAGQRTLTVPNFLAGAYTTERADDELLVHIDIPTDETARGVYLKHQTAERPDVGVALVERADGTGCVVVVGAATERPERRSFDDLDDIDAHGLASELDVVPDLFGAEDFKRNLVTVFVQRAQRALQEGTQWAIR